MNNGRIFSLYKKEILDVLRDKKTLVVMILVPLFLYPGIMFLSTFLLGQVTKESLAKTYEIGILEDSYADEIISVLTDETDEFEYLFHVSGFKSVDAGTNALQDGTIDAFISVTVEEDVPTYEISYVVSKNQSSTAGSYAQEIFLKYKENVRQEKIEALVPDADKVLNPMWIKLQNLDSDEASMGSVIGMVLPMILITSILLGAIYPAIDVTAGERERGTLETLMTVPVRVSEIMTGKFLAVATIAVFSALLNLASMLLVGIYTFDSIRLMADSEMTLNMMDFVPSVIIMLITLPVFALFVSAVCLCVCIFAKSFKEANNYSTPLLLVFMFGSMAGILPNIELNMKTALIPVVNLALLIKAVFVLQFDWTSILIVIVSSVLYSLLSVWFMSKLFSSEAILFGEGFSSFRLFESRKNMKKGQIPGVGDNVLMFGVMLLVMIYSSAKLLRFGIWGTAACQLIILLIPVLYAWYMKADMKKLFSLKLPSVWALIGGVFMWVGMLCAEQVILSLLVNVFPGMQQTSESMQATILDAGIVPAFLVISIMPALGEEFAFRGFLFGSVKSKYKPWIAILVSAVAFGAYHLNLLQFFGGVIMGIAFAWVCYATGSIWVGSLMHFINNGFSVLANYNPELIKNIPVLSKDAYTVSDYLILSVVAVVFTGLGVFFVKLRKRSNDGRTL